MYLFPCACRYERDNIFCLFIIRWIIRYLVFVFLSFRVSIDRATKFSFVKVIYIIILSNMINYDMPPKSLEKKQNRRKTVCNFSFWFGVTWQYSEIKDRFVHRHESTTAFGCMKRKRNAILSGTRITHDPSHKRPIYQFSFQLSDWFRCVYY